MFNAFNSESLISVLSGFAFFGSWVISALPASARCELPASGEFVGCGAALQPQSRDKLKIQSNFFILVLHYNCIDSIALISQGIFSCLIHRQLITVFLTAGHNGIADLNFINGFYLVN